MQVLLGRFLGVALASLLVVAHLFSLLGCSDWACGYGGPGCSEAGLVGLCGGALVREVPTDVTITYFDDTGRHEARVTSVDPSDAVEVTRLSMGRFRLLGHVDGATTLTMQIEGWAAPQRFDLVVVTPDAAVGADAATAADAGCAALHSR